MKRPPDGSLADLAKLSHEIRTPLNVLLGVLDLALETPLNREQQEYFTLMQSAGKSLMTVVNDLLEFSRIESGELRLERIPFSLRSLLDDTMAMLSFEAGKKHLRLRCELSPGLPDKLVGDPARLRQVIVNLVANAIKFSETGEIAVNVQPHPAEAGETGLCFSVADQGPGMSPETARGLFAPFHQADPSTWREHGGSGLGLSIVARLVALMDGKIWLESQPGQGSTFHFTASFRTEAPALPPDSPGQGGAQGESRDDNALDLMLIDDNPMNRRFGKILLEKAGHRVLCFGEAEQALPLLELWHPDAVLVDLNMPGMDGFAATAAIRRDEAKRHDRRLPVIALTAHVDAGVENRCRAAGMDGCIAKPVDPSALATLIARRRGPATMRRRRPAASETQPANQPELLALARPGTTAAGAALPSADPAFAGVRRDRPNYQSRRLFP